MYPAAVMPLQCVEAAAALPLIGNDITHHRPEAMSEAIHPNAAESESGYRWIGQSMKRVEDPRLLTGCGKYIDDMVLPNTAHAAVLQNPHAHARIKSIDTSRAEALPITPMRVRELIREAGARA